jgi:6-phosphogluconolactonase (cycloisomerase 2 family)
MIENCSVFMPDSPATQYYCSSAFKFSQESWMLQKALVLVIVVASIAGCVGCSSTSNHYVYAALSAANQVAAYREDPNSGTLTQIAGSPFPAGDGACALVIHPSGKFLYLANPGQNENDISLFSIASDGVLTEVLPRTSIGLQASLPQFMLIDPSGSFLYVANAGTNNISVFSIDSGTGALTAVGAPISISVQALNMQMTPSGNFLYVTAPGGPPENLGLIIGFSVTAGTLTQVSLTSTDGANPNGLAIDPSGKYLYAANTAATSSTISIFAIGTSGTLSPVSGSPLNAGYTNPVALILDPAGTYLYVANQGSSNVAVFSISSSTGLPTALTTTTTTGAFSTEASPSFLAIDASGKYLFVGNQGTSAGIQVFEISSGNLTTLPTYSVGNTPTSIAVLH